jgi:hypothetical protein
LSASGKGIGFGSGILPVGSDLDLIRWIDLLMRRLSPPRSSEGGVAAEVDVNSETTDSKVEGSAGDIKTGSKVEGRKSDPPPAS